MDDHRVYSCVSQIQRLSASVLALVCDLLSPRPSESVTDRDSALGTDPQPLVHMNSKDAVPAIQYSYCTLHNLFVNRSATEYTETRTCTGRVENVDSGDCISTELRGVGLSKSHHSIPGFLRQRVQLRTQWKPSRHTLSKFLGGPTTINDEESKTYSVSQALHPRIM